jgi:hypothetical protein
VKGYGSGPVCECAVTVSLTKIGGRDVKERDTDGLGEEAISCVQYATRTCVSFPERGLGGRGKSRPAGGIDGRSVRLSERRGTTAVYLPGR